MQLRPYQIEQKSEIRAAFNAGHRAVILCAPTGSGKTVTFVDIAKDAYASGTPCMIICNRRELMSQAQKKLIQAGLHPVVIDPNYRDTFSMTYVASIDTLKNRNLPEVKLIIVDEAHNRSFDIIIMEYLAHYNDVYCIGATATPTRDGKTSLKPDKPNKRTGKLLSPLIVNKFEKYSGQLGDIYTKLIETTTIKELIQNEYLVPCITYREPSITTEGLKLDATNEFTDKSQLETLDKPKMYSDCIGKYKEAANGLKAICFNVNVIHSKKMEEEFNKAGIPAKHVDANSKDRNQIFTDFSNGKYQVLCNCEIATTGLDIPELECVIINRFTNSLSLFLQMAGRGGRPCLKINKTHFVLIDMGTNVARLGWWQQEREWSLDLNRVRPQLAPIVTDCKNCGALIPAQVAVCPACDFILKTKKQVEEEAEQERASASFVIDDSDISVDLKKPLHEMTITELEKYREAKGYTINWIARHLITRSPEVLQQYALMKGYKSAWVNRQLEIRNKFRDEAKSDIWTYCQQNTFLDSTEIKSFAEKKMKYYFSASEIMETIPNILREFNKLKNVLTTN